LTSEKGSVSLISTSIGQNLDLCTGRVWQCDPVRELDPLRPLTFWAERVTTACHRIKIANGDGASNHPSQPDMRELLASR
jgi:hypothetical protein